MTWRDCGEMQRWWTWLPCKGGMQHLSYMDLGRTHGLAHVFIRFTGVTGVYEHFSQE